jgi:2-C-methyl-D-erythritol 4-phosphate cytidylyltransferase
MYLAEMSRVRASFVSSPANFDGMLRATLKLVLLDHTIEHVLVQDATYPLLDSGVLDAVLAAASRDALAIAVMPVTDTLKAVDARGLVSATPPRDRLWQVRSPVLAPRALLEPRLREPALATPATSGSATGWMRELCAGLPAHVVPVDVEAPRVRTRADVLALTQVLSTRLEV